MKGVGGCWREVCWKGRSMCAFVEEAVCVWYLLGFMSLLLNLILDSHRYCIR